MSERRLKQAESAALVGMIVTLLLAIMEGVIGLLGHSRALIADAAYSASVVVGTLAGWMGSRPSKMFNKDEQPNAVGRADAITTITVAVVLLVVGVEIGISAVKSIIHGITSPPHGIAAIAIVVSLLVKEIMFRYKYALGREIANQALIASAWEHRNDMYASFVALVGVTGAWIGYSLEMESLFIFDTIASLFIALLLFRMGYKLVLDSIYSSVDQVMHAGDAAELISTVQRIKGVITVDELQAREHGHYVIVDVKISVNPKISVHEGHEIARLVKQQLMKRFIHVSDVFIHVNPYDPGYPYKNNIDPEQDESPSLLH
ncbi:MAG: cation diffusion facilitator family transporter [Paenibacillaceae bacterium]